MAKFKQLMKGKRKEIILAIIAILLIVFTAYQLKLVGIAADDAVISESSEVAELELQDLGQVEENIEDDTVDETQEESNTDLEEAITENNQVEETNTSISTDNTENTETNLEESVEDVEEVEIPSELVFDNGEYKVTVSAIKEDALKNIKEVSVTPITEEANETEYNQILEELENKIEEDNLSKSEEEQLDIAGFLAYDITLIGEDGSEIEPDGSVNVSIEYLVVPDEVAEYANADVSVIHFEEDSSNGSVSLQEYSQEEQTLNVEKNDDNQIQKLEFETDSFSTFTITWTVGRNTYAQITVHYVDSQGEEIEVENTESVNVSTGAEIILAEYKKEIDGYSYQSAHYNVLGGSIITSMTFTRDSNAFGQGDNTYNVTFYNGDIEVANLDYSDDTRKIDIYLVYAEIGTLVLSDNIVESGCLNAIYLNNDGEEIISDDFTYTWYKSSSGDGEYEEVDRVKITGSSYNISDDGKSLNVALDQGGEQWYYVEITDSNGEVLSTSQKYYVNYSSEIRNGGFETPNISEYTQAEVKSIGGSLGGTVETGLIGQFPIDYIQQDFIWKTTGSDQKVEIGRYGTENNNHLNSNYNINEYPDSDDNMQFVELNCEAAGALYQDVLTIPGQDLYWSLSHRGRAGTDTMYVLIMSTKDAEKYDVTTQEKVETVLKNPEAYNAKVWKISDPQEWVTHNNNEDPYEVGEGQYLTRFFFVAGETASGNDTVGNFIDDVSVSQTIDTPTSGYATLNITKVVSGIPASEEDMTSYGLTISNNLNDSQINGNYTYNTSLGAYILSGSYIFSTGIFDSVEVILSETDPTNIISGYEFYSAIYILYDSLGEEISTGSLTGSNEILSTNSITLNEDEVYSLVITNTYKPVTTTITLNKTDVWGNLLGGATFSITEEGTSNTQKIEDTDNDGIFEFKNIKYNTTYVIEEVSSPDDGKYYTLGTEIEISVSENGQITILNSDEDESEIKKYVSLSDNGLELNVINVKHTEMPKAGGMGTHWFYILGAIIMISTIVIYKKSKKLN